MKKLVLAVCALAMVVIFHSPAEAQKMNGKMRLTGTSVKTFDSCGVNESSLPVDLRVSWNTYVNFTVKDQKEGLATSAGITNNSVVSLSGTTYPRNGGGYIKYEILINNFHKISRRTPNPTATRFFTILNGNGAAVCQIAFSGTVRRS